MNSLVTCSLAFGEAAKTMHTLTQCWQFMCAEKAWTICRVIASLRAATHGTSARVSAKAANTTSVIVQ